MTGGLFSQRTPWRSVIVYVRPSLETSALSARSGTGVKSEGPYLGPLTNLKSVRCTKDEMSCVWYDTVAWMSKEGGSRPMCLRTPPRFGCWAAATVGTAAAAAAPTAAVFRKSRRPMPRVVVSLMASSRVRVAAL